MGNENNQRDDLSNDVTSVFKALPSRFKRGIAPRDLSFQFSIDEQRWTVRVGPDSCEVMQGKAVEDADCYLKTTSEIFIGTIKGDYMPSFMDLMTGKIKTNNPALLQTFRDVFDD